jgi:hypothetical protein
MEVFLSVPGGNNRGAQARHDDLATVCVPAQDQADTLVANLLGEVGVVREQDNGIVFGGITECTAQVLTVSPWVADAALPQSLSTAFEPDADVVQIRQANLG